MTTKFSWKEVMVINNDTKATENKTKFFSEEISKTGFTELKEEKGPNKKKKWLLLLLLLLIILGVGAWLLFSGTKDSEPIYSADLLPAIGDARDRDIADIAQEIADAHYFTLIINPTVTFADGNSVGDIGIINPATNVYPIAVEITLEETNEIIYSSGGILPNQEILEAKLDKSLPKGTHKALATVNIYDPETKEKQGATQADITIIVKN